MKKWSKKCLTIYKYIQLQKILKKVEFGVEVTLVTGARQVGKSTLVSYFEEKGYKYITFDDTDLLAEAKKNSKKFIENQGYPIIIDEIQRAKELFIEIEKIVTIDLKVMIH